MLREPVVAGTFYESSAAELKKTLDKLMQTGAETEKCIAVIAPHAGYMYSGKSAGIAYSAAEVPKHIIILGPNHTGLGSMISIMDKGEWKTPLGNVRINSEIAKKLLEGMKIKPDFMAHIREHSIEVQLPFLLKRNPEIDFVPVCIAEHDLSRLASFASLIAETARQTGALIVCSTDLTHYEPVESAKAKDSLVLQAIEATDPEMLVDSVSNHDISMCGVLPAYVTLTAAKQMGARRGKILSYTTSADAGAGSDSVVGYCGAVII